MICLPDGKKYIGQHRGDDIHARKKSHIAQFKNICNKIKKGETIKNKYCRALFGAFSKYGLNKCVWVVLEKDISVYRLNEIEDYYIKEFNTLHPNGYNLKLNHSDESKVFSQETLDKMSTSQSKVYDTKLNEYRRNNTELEGLPKHVAFIKRGNKRGYKIQGHPKCESKYFLSSTKPLNELKNKALKFLAECEKNPHISDRVVKLDSGIPLGIIEKSKGYEVQYSHNKQRFSRMFTKSSVTKEENLRLAINWLNDLKAELANPNGNVNALTETNRSTKTIPKGITKCKGGYRVAFNENKTRYGACFTNINSSMEEKLEQAIEWMTNKKAELATVAANPEINNSVSNLEINNSVTNPKITNSTTIP